MEAHDLIGPFVLFEEGDEDAIFFATLDEILGDRYDVLWGERYLGYDSRGARFTIVHTVESRPLLFGLLDAERERIFVERIDEEDHGEEVRARLAEYFDAAGAPVDELLGRGLAREHAGSR